MTDKYLLTGLGIGLGLLILYLLLHLRADKGRPDASDGFRVFWTSLGALTAMKICGLALWDIRLKELTDLERAYIFFGGIAALWLCVESILRVMIAAVRTPERVAVSPNQN